VRPATSIEAYGAHSRVFNFRSRSWPDVEGSSGSLRRDGGFRFALHGRPVHPRRDGNAVALNADCSNVSPRNSDFLDCCFLFVAVNRLNRTLATILKIAVIAAAVMAIATQLLP
jgi:hypothetical protein